jgi:hypothetical protein
MIMKQLAPNYGRKAWAVIGYTYEGAVYCPECVAYTDPTITGESATDNRTDKPAPIFSSDSSDLPSHWACEVCGGGIG